MKTLKLLTLSMTLFSIILLSCKKDTVNPTADCSTTQNRDMENFFNALTSGPTYEIYTNMDLETHEYTFTNSANLQICGFGYKSQGANLSYEIKLTDSISGNVLYQGNLSFSSTAYDYISVPPITLPPGTYTLSRTILNPANFNEHIGPVTRRSDFTNMDFPKSLGDITITSSNFYGSGGPVHNFGIPNIYFEYFKP